MERWAKSVNVQKQVQQNLIQQQQQMQATAAAVEDIDPPESIPDTAIEAWGGGGEREDGRGEREGGRGGREGEEGGREGEEGGREGRGKEKR